MDSLKWLWSYVKQYKMRMLGVMLLLLLFIILTFGYPVLVGRFVDEVIMANKLSLLFFYVVVIMVLVAGKELIKYFRQLILEDISQDIVKSVRNKLFNKLQSLDCYFYEKSRTGDLMSRLTMDTDAIRMVIVTTMPELFYQVACVVVGFIILFSISVPTSIAIFAVLPFLLAAAAGLKKHSRKAFVNRREANAELNTVVRENIEGNRVVKAYAKEEYEIGKFEEKNEGYQKTFMEYIYVWCKYGPLITFFRHMTSVMFVLAGGYFVMKDIITVGEFTTINGCLWYITTPMEALGNLINQYQQFVASSIKIMKLEAEEAKIKNGNVKKRDTGISGKIEFRNVSFSYDSERVVKNLNFSIEPGQTLAVIGPTGSGKTTILNLLARFYDPEYGTVYVDDINVKNIDLATLRKNVTSAMQDVFLFSDTVRNNIAYGTPNATDEDVIRVAKLANAHDFIMKMSDGYDTVVGERGVGLSGGQRQRISLARALLKNPSILVLDDTTSALDMETEFSIQENLKNTHTTKIIIAHRISSVKNADLILVLNHGRLIEWGNHEVLMKQNGYYKGVFEHQFGDFNYSGISRIEHPAETDLISKGGRKNG
ncbi:MAG: ABC transporter ATP-binding protein [Clostridia bacterium]|nr:ABC transporter ATP-binding protein [Clostridia bacterium]